MHSRCYLQWGSEYQVDTFKICIITCLVLKCLLVTCFVVKIGMKMAKWPILGPVIKWLAYILVKLVIIWCYLHFFQYHRNIEINVTDNHHFELSILLWQLDYSLYGKRNKNRQHISKFSHKMRTITHSNTLCSGFSQNPPKKGVSFFPLVPPRSSMN